MRTRLLRRVREALAALAASVVALALVAACSSLEAPDVASRATPTGSSVGPRGSAAEGSVPTPSHDPEPTDVGVDGGTSGGGEPGTNGSTTAGGSPTTQAQVPATARHAVGTFWQTFTDPARGRTIPTLVHYPAVGRPGAVGTQAAQGAFPLVVMAHGYRLPAAGYERILTTLTAAGYITVSPAFPGTSGESGNADRSDIVNQPSDISFVIDQVVTLASTPGGLLPAIEQPDRVGLIGHSDGGLTASATAYNSRYRDRRIAAAVVMTGGRALFPGAYFYGPGMPPVLAVHGTADGNPYSGSQGLVRDATAYGVPAYLLTIDGGPHIEPFMFDTAMPELAGVINGFVDAYVRGDPGGVERMRASASASTVVRLEPA